MHNNYAKRQCINFIKNAMNIFGEGRYNQNNRYDLLVQISSLLMTLNISKDAIEKIIDELIKGSQKMIQREDQCKAMLIISQLYFTIFKDSNKVMDCLNKARRFADFAMTNPRNITLFIAYLNKILFYIEQDEKVIEIKPEQVEDIVELIRGHIRTVKNIPSEDISFLENIETYFNNTIKVIQFRKTNSEKKDFYSSIKV